MLISLSITCLKVFMGAVWRLYTIILSLQKLCPYGKFTNHVILIPHIIMEVEGKIIQFIGERSGVSKAGNPWKSREYVLETKENYPRKIAFDFFGDRADQFPLNVGDEIRLSFDIESREYQGRWYTSIRGWKSEPLAAAPVAPQAPMAGAVPPPPIVEPMNNGEDLPF